LGIRLISQSETSIKVISDITGLHRGMLHAQEFVLSL